MYLIAWESPEGQGYSNVKADSLLDACRKLRFELLTEWAATLRILYVVVG